MKRYNVITLVDSKGENVLMCRRVKPPYQGLFNLVGGKAEPGEDGLHAAYRELREESGVTAADVTLRHLLTFSYPAGGAGLQAYELMAYVGRLRHEVDVQGEENSLLWMPLEQDFFDMNCFAGEGSIGHIIQTVCRYRPGWLDAQAQCVTIRPLAEADLPILAYYQSCTAEDLAPMLAASRAKLHKGRYYEQFAVCVDGCMVGAVSLFAHEDGTVSDGVETFPPFRHCGFAAKALTLLMDAARRQGYVVQTAQVRTDNAASIALHTKLGFVSGMAYVNNNGNEVYMFRKEL